MPAATLGLVLIGIGRGEHYLASDPSPLVGNTEAYNYSTNTWTSGLASIPTQRSGAGAALVQISGRDPIAYVMGGRTGLVPHTGTPLATNEAFDVYTGVWTTMTPMPVPMMAMPMRDMIVFTSA